jgi:uncharacterized membrane protein YdjX (TVP38/TMEM64 family)
MPLFKKGKLNPALVILAVSTVIVLVALTIAVWPYASSFDDPEKIKQLVADAGPMGPVVFMGMQLLQVLIAPIPGQVTGFVGGFLFGTVLGTVYSTIGATIGFTLIFILARKLGRPFVEYFVDKKTLKRFDYIAETKGVLVLFLIFLLPIFPDDLICYIAGLTSIKIRTLILVSIAGRVPGFIALSYAGTQAAESNFMFVAAYTAVVLVALAIGYWQRERLEKFVRRFANKN